MEVHAYAVPPSYGTPLDTERVKADLLAAMLACYPELIGVHIIEDRFLGSARLDPATMSRPDSRLLVRENVSILGDLANEFDFTQPPRPPYVLDPTPFGP